MTTKMPIGLQVKLASIIVHLLEYTRPGGHPLDLHAAGTLAEDPEVCTYMAQMEGEGLIPLPRDGVYFGRP